MVPKCARCGTFEQGFFFYKGPKGKYALYHCGNCAAGNRSCSDPRLATSNLTERHVVYHNRQNQGEPTPDRGPEPPPIQQVQVSERNRRGIYHSTAAETDIGSSEDREMILQSFTERLRDTSSSVTIALNQHGIQGPVATATLSEIARTMSPPIHQQGDEVINQANNLGDDSDFFTDLITSEDEIDVGDHEKEGDIEDKEDRHE